MTRELAFPSRRLTAPGFFGFSVLCAVAFVLDFPASGRSAGAMDGVAGIFVAGAVLAALGFAAGRSRKFVALADALMFAACVASLSAAGSALASILTCR